MDINKLIKKWVLYNKYKYGNVDLNSVVSKIVYENPDLKKNIKEIIPKVKEEINNLINISREEAYNILLKEYPELLEEKKKRGKKRITRIKECNRR